MILDLPEYISQSGIKLIRKVILNGLLMEYPQQFSHCALFLSQDQAEGLYPREDLNYNCVQIPTDLSHRFVNKQCINKYGVLCEAPVEETPKKMA